MPFHHGDGPRPPARHLTATTRYLCGAAYTDRSFADRVISELVEDEHRAVAPSYEFDVEPVVRHAFRARFRWILRAAALTVVLIVGVGLLPWGVLIVYGTVLWFAVPMLLRQHTSLDWGKIALGTVLIVVAAEFFVLVPLYLLIARPTIEGDQAFVEPSSPTGFQLIVETVVFAGLVFGTLTFANNRNLLTLVRELAPEAAHQLPRLRSQRLERRAQVAGGAQDGNLLLYSGNEPFLGAGRRGRDWSMVLELRRAADPSGYAPGELVRIDPVALNRYVKRRLADLRDDSLPEPEQIAGLQLRDVIVAAGDREPTSPLVDLAARLPFPYTSRAAIEAFIRHPQASARHFLRATTGTRGTAVRDQYGYPILGAEDQEVEVSAFVHLAVEGGLLYLEYVPTMLGPLDDRFHEIDHLPRNSSDLLLRALAEAVRALPVALILAPLELAAGLFRHWTMTARMNRMDRRSFEALRYDYGARTSIRALASARGPDTFIQTLDSTKYSKLIERRLTGAVIDYLESQGVDTSELIQRVNVVHDNSVVNVSGGTFNGPAAFGREATATANGAAVGSNAAAVPNGAKKA
ncbi:hypothetical protein Afe04nite_68470 [Asanoa ferruginea]|nr:hypothetical protein Afe04nite_68470 [Asanoa ferruginea]